MTRARAPTDRVVAARLGRIPRTVWGRFAAHFKRLTRCNAVRATASPLQNVRAVCATKAAPAASNPSTAKSCTGRARRTRRRRRGAIPVRVFEYALTAAALAIAAEGLRYVRTKPTHSFYIQARINDTHLRTLISDTATGLKYFELKDYPPHITLVKVKCRLEMKKRVLDYIRRTVIPDHLNPAINSNRFSPSPIFKINSVATTFGGGHNTVAALCPVQPKCTLCEDMCAYRESDWNRFSLEYPKVKWIVEKTFHITLGTYRKNVAPSNSEDRIRKAYESVLKGLSYDRSNLTLTVAHL